MTDVQKMNRKKWAKEHIKWGVDEWKQVMFSDESIFERFGTSGRQYMYYYSNAEHKQKIPIISVRTGDSHVTADMVYLVVLDSALAAAGFYAVEY